MQISTVRCWLRLPNPLWGWCVAPDASVLRHSRPTPFGADLEAVLSIVVAMLAVDLDQFSDKAPPIHEGCQIAAPQRQDALVGVDFPRGKRFANELISSLKVPPMFAIRHLRALDEYIRLNKWETHFAIMVANQEDGLSDIETIGSVFESVVHRLGL